MSLLEDIQKALNAQDPGWHVNHYVCIVGAERVNSEGELESLNALFIADGQAPYITNGLLCAIDELRYCDDEAD